MRYFNHAIMSAVQQPKLKLSPVYWSRLLLGLRKRGEGVRESGAFLLGHTNGNVRIAVSFVLYDELDPDCLEKGYIHFDGKYYGQLMEICRCYRWNVVADVHTHPFGPGQSYTDQTHPMISVPGHIALIIPNFAQGNISLSDVGVYVYHGRYTWTTYRGTKTAEVLEI